MSFFAGFGAPATRYMAEKNGVASAVAKVRVFRNCNRFPRCRWSIAKLPTSATACGAAAGAAAPPESVRRRRFLFCPFFLRPSRRNRTYYQRERQGRSTTAMSTILY